MHFVQKTIFSLCLFALTGLVLPPDTFAQTDNGRLLERQDREDREDRGGRVQRLRQKADELRSQYLNSTTTSQEERSSSIEKQETREVKIDRTPLKEKVDEFKEAKQAAQEQPEVLESKKALLLYALDSLIEHTALLEHKTNRFPVIRQNLKESIMAEIEAELASLENFRFQVQEASTQEELRQLAQQIKEHRSESAETKIRKLMLLGHADVFEYQVLQVALGRANVIGEHLNEFEQNGKNVAQLEELLQDADELITEASTDLDGLRNDVVANDITGEFMQELQGDFHDIQQKIGESYSLFRQIAQEAQQP